MLRFHFLVLVGRRLGLIAPAEVGPVVAVAGVAVWTVLLKCQARRLGDETIDGARGCDELGVNSEGHQRPKLGGIQPNGWKQDEELAGAAVVVGADAVVDDDAEELGS
jgi:hypothetical protein